MKLQMQLKLKQRILIVVSSQQQTNFNDKESHDDTLEYFSSRTSSNIVHTQKRSLIITRDTTHQVSASFPDSLSKKVGGDSHPVLLL